MRWWKFCTIRRGSVPPSICRCYRLIRRHFLDGPFEAIIVCKSYSHRLQRLRHDMILRGSRMEQHENFATPNNECLCLCLISLFVGHTAHTHRRTLHKSSLSFSHPKPRNPTISFKFGYGHKKSKNTPLWSSKSFSNGLSFASLYPLFG